MARIFMVICALVLFCSSSAYAQIVGSPLLSPSPGPAPAPPYVNLTDLLSVAGPFLPNYGNFCNVVHVLTVYSFSVFLTGSLQLFIFEFSNCDSIMTCPFGLNKFSQP